MRRTTFKRFFHLSVILFAAACNIRVSAEDTRLPLQWRMGIEVSPALVPGTCSFLKGENTEYTTINNSLAGALRADFSFNPQSYEGRLYPGLYQGMGVEVRSFLANSLMGTPVSAYVYQGAPIAHFNKRLWLGYEWKFGAAFGWKHKNAEPGDGHRPISTPVTAYMSAGFKLHYALSPRWQVSVGAEATHFSNGNTSLPNAGVNSIGATIGLTRIINPLTADGNNRNTSPSDARLTRRKWFYDITAYGAWRKRVVTINGDMQLCPANFAVAGLIVSPMRRLNRMVAIGGALDIQYDESSYLAPYWVEGTSGDDIKFYRPPFGKQLSAGLSAHAELTMPIFAVNAGLGYDILCPKGEKPFYQSLTLKTFIMRNIYINVGYRLGKFSDPQNLMLGAGVRL